MMEKSGGIMGEIKKIPWWAWVAIGLLVVGVLIARARSASSTGSTTASGTTTTGGDTSATTDQSGAILAALEQLTQTQQAANGATASTPGTVPQEILQGAGYWLGAGNETPIQDTKSGSWFQWLSPTAAAAQPGITRYIQTLPGVFTPVTKGVTLPAGTPQFVLGGPPIPGYNYGAKVTAA